MNLFTYGSLTRRRRIEALVGRRLGDPEAALLHDYAYVPTPRGFPIVLPRKGTQVNGWIWEIEPEDLTSLDHYEGSDQQPPFYIRKEVKVHLDRGGIVLAQVYVGNTEISWSNAPSGWRE